MKPPKVRRWVMYANCRYYSVYAPSREWARAIIAGAGIVDYPHPDAFEERPLSSEPVHVEEHWERAGRKA